MRRPDLPLPRTAFKEVSLSLSLSNLVLPRSICFCAAAFCFCFSSISPAAAAFSRNVVFFALAAASLSAALADLPKALVINPIPLVPVATLIKPLRAVKPKIKGPITGKNLEKPAPTLNKVLRTPAPAVDVAFLENTPAAKSMPPLPTPVAAAALPAPNPAFKAFAPLLSLPTPKRLLAILANAALASPPSNPTVCSDISAVINT